MDHPNSSQPPNFTTQPTPVLQRQSSHLRWTVIIVFLVICIAGIGIASFTKHKQQSSQPHKTIINAKPTSPAKPSNRTTALINQKIVVCKEALHQEGLMSIQDGALQTIGSTTREFLTLPNNIYPFANVSTTETGATMRYISNGGPLPPTVHDNCWSVYYEFDTKTPAKSGSVDITAKSTNNQYPDFHAHIIVQ